LGVEDDLVAVRGAVLIKVEGRARDRDQAPLSPELQLALSVPRERPLARIVQMAREDGLLAPLGLMAALVVAAMGAAVEAILLRGVLDVGRRLGLVEQRLIGILAFLFFLGILLQQSEQV
jgi:ATP-binding cassette subfamily B protein